MHSVDARSINNILRAAASGGFPYDQSINSSVLFKAQHGIYATDLLSEHLDGCHHSSNVDTSSEGVQGNVLLFTRSSHPLTHLLQKLQADQHTESLGFSIAIMLPIMMKLVRKLTNPLETLQQVGVGAPLARKPNCCRKS